MTRPDDARRPGQVAPVQPVQPVQPVRVVFCGMTGQFSLLVLEELLRAGVAVVAIVLPPLRGRTGQPPLLRAQPAPSRGVALPLFAASAPRTILDIAAERNIPVYELNAETLRVALPHLAFDAIAVACFSRRLPASLLRLPRFGCLNVHPSLLPAHRGPDPLFWIFHDGDEVGGVSIHLMDEGFDSGPLIVQEAIPLPDGMREAELERVCASRGGALLAEALAGLHAGAIQPQPQDATRATYESWPTEGDYTVTPAWSARRAYRFLAGIGGRSGPVRFVADNGATFTLRAALGYDADATLDAPWRLDGAMLTAQCASGVLRCQIAL